MSEAAEPHCRSTFHSMSKSAGVPIGALHIDHPGELESRGAPSADLAALAHGGRVNFMGFVMRLVARLPFLFIAGRLYGAAELGPLRLRQS